MKATDALRISDCIENEGFHYTFNHWSDFDEIKDAAFQAKLANYKEATKELADYVGVIL